MIKMVCKDNKLLLEFFEIFYKDKKEIYFEIDVIVFFEF